MYCPYCAYDLDQDKAEKKAPKLLADGKEIPVDAGISFCCPRCGHLIHEGLTPEEVSSLSRASHAQVQRGRNSFATGMGSLCLGGIALITSLIFFLLARKPSNQFQLVVDCAEFYVFVILAVISVILLAFGAVSAILGQRKKRKYLALLEDINHRTFVQ